MFSGVVFENVLKDPTEGRRIRSYFSLDILGKPGSYSREILQRSGASPVDIGAFIEDHVYIGKTKVGDAAHGLYARSAGHGRDDGISNLVFNNVRAAIPPRQDDDLGLAQVGSSIHGEMHHRPCSPETACSHERKNQQLISG